MHHQVMRQRFEAVVLEESVDGRKFPWREGGHGQRF